MKMKKFLKQLTQSLSVALFIGFPVAGWSATVSDRPLFVDSAVDHNLMFVVDDSGSMDFEVLAPKVGSMSKALVNDYIFNPGDEWGAYGNGRTYSSGKRLVSDSNDWWGNLVDGFRDFVPEYYYLRASDYNLQFYDHTAEYSPWPSTTSNSFTNINPAAAPLDPGLSNSNTANLQQAGALGLPSGIIPASFFVKDQSHSVERLGLTINWGSCPSGWNVYDTSQCRRCDRWGGCYWHSHYEYQGRPYTTEITVD